MINLYTLRYINLYTLSAVTSSVHTSDPVPLAANGTCYEHWLFILVEVNLAFICLKSNLAFRFLSVTCGVHLKVKPLYLHELRHLLIVDLSGLPPREWSWPGYMLWRSFSFDVIALQIDYALMTCDLLFCIFRYLSDWSLFHCVLQCCTLLPLQQMTRPLMPSRFTLEKVLSFGFTWEPQDLNQWIFGRNAPNGLIFGVRTGKEPGLTSPACILKPSDGHWLRFVDSLQEWILILQPSFLSPYFMIP